MSEAFSLSPLPSLVIVLKAFNLLFFSVGPLLELIQKRERFTEREASEVTREVASALSFLHRQGTYTDCMYIHTDCIYIH